MSGGAACLPVVARIAMPFGQSTVCTPTPHRDHAVRPSPSAPGSVVAVSGGRDTRREETSHPGGRSPSMHPYGRCLWLRRWVVPRTTHFRKFRLSRRLAHGPMSRMLIQLGTPCHTLVQRRHMQSHQDSTSGATFSNLLRWQRGERLGRTGRPARGGLYARSIERGASARQAIGSRARTAPFTAASTPTHRPRLLRVSETRRQTVRHPPVSWWLPPPGVAVTLVSPWHRKDVRRLWCSSTV